jgi:hypothetical protein
VVIERAGPWLKMSLPNGQQMLLVPVSGFRSKVVGPPGVRVNVSVEGETVSRLQIEQGGSKVLALTPKSTLAVK